MYVVTFKWNGLISYLLLILYLTYLGVSVILINVHNIILVKISLICTPLYNGGHIIISHDTYNLFLYYYLQRIILF